MAVKFGRINYEEEASNFNSMHKDGQAIDALNLKKKDVLDLDKGLEEVTVSVGWDVTRNGANADLDIAAFMLNENKRVADISTDVIYFNHMKGEGISLEGDNLTGAGEGDDERIQISLSKIPDRIKRIVFVVTIHEAAIKKQTFGMVNNAYVRLLNRVKNNEEVGVFNLKEHGSTATSVIFSELYKENGSWKYKAIGEGKIGDLNDMLKLYI